MWWIQACTSVRFLYASRLPNGNVSLVYRVEMAQDF